jgi:hypothetical protein
MPDEQKGLKFYLCQTPAGPQYVHLQADAKKIDPNYETVFVDTSKQAIMDRLNHLMRGPIRAIDDTDEPEEPAEPTRRPAFSAYPDLRPPAVLARVERMYEQIDVETFLFAVPLDEIYRLDALEAIIKDQRERLLNPGVRKPQPTEPERTGRKQWGKKA